MKPQIDDPWAPDVLPVIGSGPSVVAMNVLACVIGAAGPVARLLQQGFDVRALVVALLAVGWAALLWWRPAGAKGLLLMGAVALIAAAASWSTIGRAPVLVALAGVWVAHAALVRWSPTTTWPARTVSVAGLAMLPAAAAQVMWFRTGNNLTVALLLILGQVVVESYHRAPDRLARWDARFARGLVAVAGAVSGIILFVVVTALLYLPGLLGRLVDRIRRASPRRSYWNERSPAREEMVRDAGRPFATADQRARRLRHLTGVVTLVALIGAVLVLVDDRRSAQEELAELERADVFERGEEVRFRDLAAFDGVEFADAMKEEQNSMDLLPTPVGGYDLGDFSGEFTNVTDAVRHTIPSSCAGCPTRMVWLIGGSAAFGLGQRDEHTIASELVRLAAADGIALHVLNLAVPGWTIHQEAQKIEHRLADADEPPDLVLFHNGYNDVVGTVMDSTVNGIRPDEPALMETEVLRRFSAENLDPWSAGTPEELGALAADKYERVRMRVGRLLADQRVEVLNVFQPDALASDAQYDEVKHIYDVSERVREHLDRALETAARALSPDVVDMRHLLDRAPPVFADLVHTNEAGARVVAASIDARVDWAALGSGRA